MKPIKVFFLGKRLKDIYPFATRWEMFKYKVRRLIRKAIMVSFLGALVGIGLFIGKNSMAETVYVNVTNEKVVTVEVDSKAPVLERIAKCESEGKHMTNGQVTVNGNTNGSVDIGKYQINMAVWGKKAAEMGLNLAIEADNEAFATYLYKNLGTEPWVWSKKCWNK